MSRILCMPNIHAWMLGIFESGPPDAALLAALAPTRQGTECLRSDESMSTWRDGPRWPCVVGISVLNSIVKRAIPNGFFRGFLLSGDWKIVFFPNLRLSRQLKIQLLQDPRL